MKHISGLQVQPLIVYEIAAACTIDDSLNIIFTGRRIFSNPPFGSVDSVLTAKYSSGGVLRWERTYFYSITANSGEKITTDENGNIYVGGGTVVSGFGVYLTLKYDRNGVQKWAKIYDAPGSGDNTLRAIEIDGINNALLVTGGAVTNGIQMATTIKYNLASGDSVWIRRDTGTYSRANNSAIIVDSSGYCYVTGGTYNLGLFPFDIMTRKYSGLGNTIWYVTYNGPFNGIDYGVDLALDNFRNVYVLATSESGAGIRDYIVIKYNQLTNINPISNNIPLKFILQQNYPNPFNPRTRINFSIPTTCFIQLKIYDVLGRIIEIPVNEKLHPSEYELSVNASNYSSGVYFYQLIADGSVIDTRKMIVLK